MIPRGDVLMHAFLLLCAATILACVVLMVLRGRRWIHERRHMAMLQDELDEAERVGKARDARARAFMQAASKRGRV